MSTVSSGGPSLPSYHALNSQIKNEHHQNHPHNQQQQQQLQHHHQHQQHQQHHLSAPPPPPPPHHAASSAHYSPVHKHHIGDVDGGSPPSPHSSPYVSPRLQSQRSSDHHPHPMIMPSPMAMGNAGPPGMPGGAGVFESPPVAAPLRRGAVSGASGPLSFPPLPPLRHSSISGESRGGGGGVGGGSGPYPAYGSHGYPRPVEAGVGPREHDPNGMSGMYNTPPPPPPPPHLLAPNGSSPYHPSAGNLYHPSGAYSSHRDGSAPGSSYSSWSNSPQSSSASRLPYHQPASNLGPSTAGPGPSFPLPSSYSLSAVNHPHHAGSPQPPPPYPGHSPGPSQPHVQSQLGPHRRGGLSASSGIGVYGAAGQGGPGSSGPPPPPHTHPSASAPYWIPGTTSGPPGAPVPIPTPVATGGGFKRKQTSANPPPRNYGCPSCPASFSRRHDLNRHSRIHLAVKPFGCPNCQKTFSRKDALKRHLMVKGCGNDADGRPRKRRGRKSNAEKASEAAALSTNNGGGGGSGDKVKEEGDSVDAKMLRGVSQGGDEYGGGEDDDDDDEEEEEDEEDEEDDENQGSQEQGHVGGGGGGEEVRRKEVDGSPTQAYKHHNGGREYSQPGQGGMMSFGDMGATQ